jgi:hypothetical protein
MSVHPPGEICEERESQGGGPSIFLSGGDEHSEPESQIETLSVVSETHEQGNGREAERGGAAPASALPCQRSNNCIEKEDDENESPAESLSPYRRKCRHRLIMAVEWLVKKYGVNHVGLLTLTFGVPGSGRGSQATKELREQAKDFGICAETMAFVEH